jgi:glycosyltransferase involved in cell wall biosynthesis
MKICYFADAPSLHVIRWCKYFAALGYEVHLISFKSAEIENVKTYLIDVGSINVSGGNWRVLLKFPAVKKLLKQIKPDIFHAMYATSYGITGALCGFHPYVITTLGTDVLISPKHSKIIKLLLQFAFKKADWITAMADHMKIAIEEMGVLPSKISTVPFGIDTDIFNDHNRKLPTNKFVITSTRNFEPVYNIPHLIRAVAIAKNAIPNLHLNLAGNGTLLKEIERLLLQYNLAECTKLIGFIPSIRLSELLKESHLVVTVSKSDGNNISLNEAMACGALCIATNIPANTQWITNGENGFLVEINDDQTLAQRIIEAYNNYNALQEKFLPINKKIINEKADWKKNIKIAEIKYNELITK